MTKRTKNNVLILILITIIGLSSTLIGQYRGRGRKILFDKNSLYYRIVVFDKKYLRYLVFGTQVYQTVMHKKYPDMLLFEYAKTFASTIYLRHKTTKNLLLLGLGGGALVKFIKRYFPDKNLDVAEIDPLVIKVAKKYFHTKFDSKRKIYAYDGRIFIKRVNKKYDVIMLDAYNSDYIPFHLMTKEFLNEVRSKLSPNGFVMQNIWTTNALLKRTMTTFKSVFKYVYYAKGRKTSNGVILASNKRINFSNANIRKAYRKFKKDNIRYTFRFLNHLKRYVKYNARVNGALILTDDHAPVNYYHRRQ